MLFHLYMLQKKKHLSLLYKQAKNYVAKIIKISILFIKKYKNLFFIAIYIVDFHLKSLHAHIHIINTYMVVCVCVCKKKSEKNPIKKLK